jgi:pimeloyl-ACP methyl ester carboxylesterase
VLVFLHGFPEAALVLGRVARAFRRIVTACVAPNLRGYERSSAPSEVAAYRAKHLVGDIAGADRFARRLVAARWIAHDWGGALAWGLAATARGDGAIDHHHLPHPATSCASCTNRAVGRRAPT